MTKYIFVAGGVMSGVGKGVASASVGSILQGRGFEVTNIKIDPYVNVDAGTMNPTEHGEVFVLDEGTECDQDMGNYERFLGKSLPAINYMTTGSVYHSVIKRERSMGYGGKCVEVVPHIPMEVISRVEKAAKFSKADFTIVEIGGTVGEYQNVLFLEAARMMKLQHPKDVIFILVSYLPLPSKIGEMKTKPTQHAVRTLNSAGIQPDIIIARSRVPLDKKRKEKIAFNCSMAQTDVISAPDIESIYEVPVNFEKDKLSDIILRKVKLRPKKKDLRKWRKLSEIIKNTKRPVNIGIVGKYFDTGDFILSDAYISVIEAVKHAALDLKRKPFLSWINAEEFEPALTSSKEAAKNLRKIKNFDGVIVPGGFGSRGAEGKIAAIEFCRKNKIPTFGLCYGMQLMVIEFARNVCDLKKAHTTEIDRNTRHPVIDILPEQKKNLIDKNFGASMRLGAYPAVLKNGSRAERAYRQVLISERHRHRFEVNPNYIDKLKSKGLVFSGFSPDDRLMEILELSFSKHPFFLGTQFHPEFNSNPFKPHPLFREFIRACIRKK